jgi:hypothetical protein
MDKFYLYKMTTDSGGAPYADDEMLSRAICKPVIRRTAHEGDIIFGFGGNKMNEVLIYAATISKIVRNCDYYRDNIMYSNRQDCIYWWQGDELVFREGSKFHGQWHRDHDVGLAGQHNGNANVIIANEFAYFGKNGTDGYKTDYKELERLIGGMRQGHRINHSTELLDELRALYRNCIESCSGKQIQGSPHHKPDNCVSCSEIEGEVECVSCSATKTG